MWQIEIRRGDIRVVERIKDVFVNLANAQEACKASRAGSLLKLVNSVEPAAEQLVAWLHMVSDVKGRHIHDLEDAVVVQAQRGDANAARCKDLHEQLLHLRGQLAEATQRRDASEARYKDLEVQLQDLRGQLADKRGDANEARCKDLEGKLQGLQGQLAEQRAALERATAAQQKLTEEAAKARDAERRAANLQLELERQVKRGDAIETRCKDLEGQLQRARDAVTRTQASQKGPEKVSEPALTTTKRKPTAEAAKAQDADTECDVIILL